MIDSPAGEPAGLPWSDLATDLESLKRRGLWLPGPTAALEVLGLTGVERAHQAYIAWLLDPRGTHGLGEAVLASVLQLCGAADGSPDALRAARVKSENVRERSRADIVVSMPERTLVIELKVHSGEGDEQTRRLADDYADSPRPCLVFLTLNGDQPLDPRFQSRRLDELAICLRAALAAAPEPQGDTRARGRAVAADYLYALKRKCGMEPVNQRAALFWLRYGSDMEAARCEAVRLLDLLPARIESALRVLAGDLPSPLQVSRVEYVARGRKDTSYSEVAVLLHRPQWTNSHGQPRFGAGAGQRTKGVDPFDNDKSPFFGVWAEDSAARALLGDGQWHNWAWWDSVDLTPPAQGGDLLDWYTAVAVQNVRQAWLDNIKGIDEIARQVPS